MTEVLDHEEFVQRIFDAIDDAREPPEGDASWEGWFHSQLDDLSAKVGKLADMCRAAPASAAEPVDAALEGIAEIVEETGGGWKPCSGCYDTEDGHPTRKYDYSHALKTDVGCGCHECGGLGAVWEYYSEADIAAMQEEFLT